MEKGCEKLAVMFLFVISLCYSSLFLKDLLIALIRILNSGLMHFSHSLQQFGCKIRKVAVYKQKVIETNCQNSFKEGKTFLLVNQMVRCPIQPLPYMVPGKNCAA